LYFQILHMQKGIIPMNQKSMNQKQQFHIGQKVYFGRANGEKTLGEIVKINAKSIQVKQLQTRGLTKIRQEGTLWRVAPSLLTPYFEKDSESSLKKDSELTHAPVQSPKATTQAPQIPVQAPQIPVQAPQIPVQAP